MYKGIYLKDKDNNKIFPLPYYQVGDLYLTTRSDNPSTIFGGTWELFGPGRTLVCINTSDTPLNAAKKTGGSTNPLTSHGHSIGWPAGTADIRINSNSIAASASITIGGLGGTTYGIPGANNTGDNTNHNNWQPFIVCYIWIRTA